MSELDDLKKLTEMIVRQDTKSAVEATEACVAAGVNPREIINAISGGLKKVGDMFENCELFLPEVVASANAAKTSLQIVLPLLRGSAGEGEKERAGGSVAIGSMGPHDIGKSIVSSMLMAEGFDVLDLGTNLSGEKVVQAVRESRPDVLAISILLTSDVERAAEIIKGVRALREIKIKIIVGGAAVNESAAERIGADAFGKDAHEAVRLAKSFTGRGER